MPTILIRILWTIGAIASLGLGIAGLLLPLVPGIPFIVITLICLERLSPKFRHWLIHTKIMHWLRLNKPKLAKWITHQ